MKRIVALASIAVIASLSFTFEVHAQLSSNPDKFLGNITTRGSVNGGGVEFKTLWNQITPENESKWQSVEYSRGKFTWTGCDNAYNYAKRNNFPFKFHCLVWGAQYPTWMDRISTSEQLKAITNWMDAIKKRYPDIPLIDVVNEAVPGHQPAPYREALGGDGITGYDWIIKAFEMAHERWPDAILIYNDYNTFQWQKNEFISLVQTLIDAGAPIDAYGCQSHDLTDMNVSSFKSAMKEIHDALQIPMYSTEYDIGTSDDNLQLQRYKEQIPYMWEADYVAGITLWGYIYGSTWTTDGNSGIIRNGKDRPAMTWLREYMATDAALGAKGPFPGGVKEASVYVAPSSLYATVNEPFDVTVRARLKTKTIDHIDLYVNGNLLTTFTEAPYIASYTAPASGKVTLKAVVTATDGSTYERLSHVTVNDPRKPYKSVINIPGTIQAENFDCGGEGVAYHDTSAKDEGGTRYRTDGGAVDVVSCNTGRAIGYTTKGEWLEYTVNVQTAGKYAYEAYVSSGADGSSIRLSLSKNGQQTYITNVINVPNNGNWDTYRAVKGDLTQELEEGEQIIRLNITGSSANIDRIILKCTEPNAIAPLTASPITTYEVFSTNGTLLGHITASPAGLSAALYRLTHHEGIYLLRDTATNRTERHMATKQAD